MERPADELRTYLQGRLAVGEEKRSKAEQNVFFYKKCSYLILT